jgi:hypothetical protein
MWAERFSSLTSTLATFAVPSSDARSALTVSSAPISWNSGVLSPEEQEQMSDYVSLLLTSIDHAEGT